MPDDAKAAEGLPEWRCSWCGWLSTWPESSGGCPACAPQRQRRGLPAPPAEVDCATQDAGDE